jgi:hypothetical protein
LAALRPEAAPPKVVQPETPVVPPPVVTPSVIPPPTPAPDTIVQPQTQASNSDANGGSTGGAAGTGGGGGGGNGGGQGPGTGGGAGPGTGGSERGVPPQLKGFAIMPTEGVPKSLRGKDVALRCYVNAEGRVDRWDSDPVIADRGYRDKLDNVIAGYRFKPARDSIGLAVPGVALVTLTFPTH